LKAFGKHFPYLGIKELVEYYAVFDGYEELESLTLYETLQENIKENILKKYNQLHPMFIYSDDKKTQQDIEKLLFRIAVGNRKIHSIYKNDISQFKGSSLYKTLFSKDIIFKEHSREKMPLHPLKKEFRRYKIEDKIIFSRGFNRFWFTFIAPYAKLIEKGGYDEVLKLISDEIDKYISLSFEMLSNDLILKEFDITESGSYWDRYIELDIMAKTSNGKTIAGEAKWKNQKISKNTLNKLQKKCELAGLKVDYFALFSKSGFSNELLKKHDKNVLLYDIDSFKGLLDDR
jgi:hypothetical protein